jgi:hypothetical protein
LCLGSDRPDNSRPAPPVQAARADVVKDSGERLPSAADIERLARTDPVAFFEQCLRRYAREVKGYSLTMHKQENIGGKIHPTEVIEVHFLDKPHSVFFNWQEGARLAERALYVEGQNDGKMLARPKGGVARLVAGDVVARDVNGPDARQSARSTLDQFGFKKTMERSLVAWKAAREEKTLQFEYQGVKKIKEAGNRDCWVLRRTARTPENDVKETTLYFDTETWLQVGIVQKDAEGLLVASYWFRDIKLNPEFKNDQFQPASLKQ